MSYPTVLGPWYVVQQLQEYHRDGSGEPEREMEYYTSMDEGKVMWTEDPHLALIFTSLHSAARVARSEGAQIRVLTTKEEANDFGRG